MTKEELLVRLGVINLKLTDLRMDIEDEEGHERNMALHQDVDLALNHIEDAIKRLKD